MSSSVPLVGREYDHVRYTTTFWDGDRTTQSFMRIMGLATPPTIRPRPRPSSAPARSVKTFKSPRRDCSLELAHVNATPHSSFAVSDGGSDRGSLHHHVMNEREIQTTTGSEDVEIGKVRILQHRLRRLERENSYMRNAVLNTSDDMRLERLTQAHRRNQELIAALLTARAAAARRARRNQDRFKALQSQLRSRNSQQLPSGIDRGQGPLSLADQFTKSQASASRPHSAPQQSLRIVQAGTAKSRATLRGSSKRVADIRGAGKANIEPTQSGHAPTKVGTGEAGRGEGQESGGLGDVAARPKMDACVRCTISPERQTGAAASAGEHSPSANLRDTSNVGRSSVGEVEATSGCSHEGTGATVATRQESTRILRTDARESGGDHGGKGGGRDKKICGYGSNHHDVAPRMLLAREAEAAIRRAERLAAAKAKEEEELRVSSSFRARESNPASGPDWATIKAHQDMVRKQRTRDRAAFLAATSSLPPRMARYAAMQEVAEDGAACKDGKSGGVARARDSRSTAWSDAGFGFVAGGGGLRALDTGHEELQDIRPILHRRQKRWEASLAAAKASHRTAVTRPRTPPMEKRRLLQEAKRREREKAELSAREAAAKQRHENDKRQFRQLLAMHRASGSTYKGTKASVRKAEETRLKIQQDIERGKRERTAELAEEARRREVSRAVREYVAASEARRREEHGAGPPLEELIRRKKEERDAEYRERQRLNRAGLRQALRKRPNLLERQEKFAQQHSRRVAAQALSAREFLESREGFPAAGRRALRDEYGGWMQKAAADETFSTKEKEELGLPVLAPDAICSGGNSDATATVAGDGSTPGGEDDVVDSPVDDPSAGSASARLPSSSGSAPRTGEGGGGGSSPRRGQGNLAGEARAGPEAGSLRKRTGSAESRGGTADGGTCSTSAGRKAQDLIQDGRGSAAAQIVRGSNSRDREHSANLESSVSARRLGDEGGEAIDFEAETSGRNRSGGSSAAWGSSETND